MHRWHVFGAMVAAGGLWAAGCAASGSDGTEAEAAAAAPVAAARGTEEALPVEVTTLKRGSIEASLRASANLEAESSVAVYARSEGLVRELFAEEGARVQNGELLLRLEDEEQRNQLAKVRSQLDQARRTYERQQRLFREDLISEEAFSEATYEIEQLEISLDDAQRQLAQTEIRAPIDGTVTARLVDEGDRVQPGAHLFDLVDFASLVARIYVPEKELDRLERGLRARVTSQAVPGRLYRGQLVRVAPIVDARSGTVKATVSIGRQEGLLPGMYVDVSLVTDVHRDALLVPKRALVFDGDQAYIYRVGRDARVERIAVESVLSDEDHVEPAGERLNAGDRVVVAGQAALKDGALVRTIDGGGAGGDSAPRPEESIREAAR